MPKKFSGENSKAVAARTRKSSVKEVEDAKKQRDAEEAYWKDNDKHITRKLQRKQDSEQKKQQSLQKKAELKAILEKEMNSISSTSSKQAAVKITRAQIESETVKRNATTVQVAVKTCKLKTHVEQPLEENSNRMQPEEIANTIDEALAMLSVKGSNLSEDIHPEKRLKAAYLAFEEKQLPILKQKNPSLRMSQLKQILFKNWSKSSENPLNKVK